MKKTLYSLMLSDDVVREVDLLAHRTGTNRSNLVNQILAEYFSMTTPERRVSDIFQAVEELLSPSRELIPFFAPNAMSMSMKSCLEYKYRPTVKYEVQLYRSGEDSLGELSVAFRTQSQQLIAAMTDFFRLWKALEEQYFAPRAGRAPQYALYDGRFVREILVPAGRDCSSEEIAQALSDYIQEFDSLMKGYLGGGLDAPQVEKAYRSFLAGRDLLI